MGVAVMFPGQGSQSPGMGSPWQNTGGWTVVQRAEEVLDEPLERLLVDEDPGVLRRTREAQLAVFLTSLVAWESARAALGEIVAFAGHSLGQLTALTAAGVLHFDDAVGLVATRGEVTQAAADAAGGGMVALLGADGAQATAACDAALDSCWVANDNAPGQVVLSGTDDGLERASVAARAIGVRKVVRLDVDGPFHTPLMQPAAQELAVATATVPVHLPQAPVVSNADACAYSDADGWRARLVDHLVSAVQWRRTLDTLAGLGADRLAEVGPGRVLTGLARKARPDLQVESAAGAPA
ncbi:MAG: fabD [Acidimicrobiales bacterium]|nr:fabD [Acidimicrobiales bacterium]